MLYATTNPQFTDARRAMQASTPAAVWRAVTYAPFKLMAWIVEQRRARRMIATLESLSDHTLEDIGIERSQIRRVARQGQRRG